MSVTGNVPISHEFRHNVSLAVKEIVNNALKHSFATEIRMSIEFDGRLLRITIADDGVGITREPGKDSLGLSNITQRMASIRGKCAIEAIDDKGLKVSLEAPIN
jgi:signal transduction histidine kinase